MAQNYYVGVQVLEDKLAEMLDEKSLLHVMDKNKYPITLTVTQNRADDAQMALYDMSEGSVSSRDSVLRLVISLEGMEIQTSERFVIEEKFMNKIKNQAKKIHAAYVHAFFASNIDILRNIKTDEDGNVVSVIWPDTEAGKNEDIDENAAAEDDGRFDDFFKKPGEELDAEDYDEGETPDED